jgi:hypothetical protein
MHGAIVLQEGRRRQALIPWKASDGSQTTTDEPSEWSLLLNLDVGWSF